MTDTPALGPSPNPFAALESPYDSDGEDPPTPALLCAITPSPILADSGATHVLLRESVLPSLSPTSCTLPPFHLCLSPYPMVPSSPPNLAVTSIFRASLSPSRFGPPLTRFCPTLS